MTKIKRPTARLAFEIPDELHYRLKIEIARRRLTYSEVITPLIEWWVDGLEQSSQCKDISYAPSSNSKSLDFQAPTENISVVDERSVSDAYKENDGIESSENNGEGSESLEQKELSATDLVNAIFDFLKEHLDVQKQAGTTK